MSIQKNPASDLKFFINRFRALSESRPNNAALDVWTTVFRVHERVIFEKLIALQKLILNLEVAITNDPELLVKERYLSCIAPIKKALLPSQLQKPSNTFATGVFAEHGNQMMALDFCIERLSKTKPETQIPDETLGELRAEGQDLLATVLENVEDVKLRLYLAELLQCFNFGIESYEICGVSSIEDSLNTVIGKLQTQKGTYSNVSENDKPIMQRLLNFLHKGGKVAEDAQKIAGVGRIGYEVLKQISP